MYKQERRFRIWFYSVSHSTLIIRSEKQYPDVKYNAVYSPNNTIDLHFSGVEFISLPDTLEKVIIEKEGKKYVFNNNPEHFVLASSCIVGLSDWNSDEGMFSNRSMEYDEIVIRF